MTDRKRFPSEQLDQYMLRFPPGLRDLVKDAAAGNARSMNSEIVARLESTFEELGPYSAIGMNAFVKRLEASLDISESLMVRLAAELRMAAGVVDKDDPPIRSAIQKFADENNMNLAVATQHILTDWLREQNYLPGGPMAQSGTEMSEGEMIANADEVRSRAGDAADKAMAGMDATDQEKAARRKALTAEPAAAGKARGRARSDL